MFISIKTDYRLWPLLIFALLLLPSYACSTDNPGETVKKEVEEAAEDAVREIESPFGRWGAILPVSEGETFVGTVYRNSEQEIIIRYQFGPYNAITTRFYNFSTGELEAECKESNCSKEIISGLTELEEERISFVNYTLFGGGFRRRVSGGSVDRTSMDEGYETLLPDGTLDYIKILQMSNERFWALTFRFYALNDDIVLGLAVNRPFVVVFRKNLTSPFFENNETLIRMDGNLADSIYRVCSADARVKGNTGQDVWKAADACFIETVENGISDDLKKTLEKRIEQFYVSRESINSNHRPDNGEWIMFLPFPEEYEGLFLPRVYFNAKQEIIIRYSLNVKEDRYWRIFNLSRGTLEHEYKVMAEQYPQHWIDEKTAGLTEIRRISRIGGATINERFSIKDIELGAYALRSGYEVTSPNGDVRYEKIIRVSPEKHKYIYGSRVATDIKEENHIHVRAYPVITYQLDEKTLLGRLGHVRGMGQAFVLFRNDMTSPYFEDNTLFIQMDGKRADSVYEYCTSYNPAGRWIDVENIIENTDKCFVEFLKGE